VPAGPLWHTAERSYFVYSSLKSPFNVKYSYKVECIQFVSLDGNKVASLCLTLHHELVDLPRIISVTLIDNPSLFKDVDEVLGLDLWEVVSDEIDGLVRLSALKSLRDEDIEGSVEC